jgi:hypothetical protein
VKAFAEAFAKAFAEAFAKAFAAFRMHFAWRGTSIEPLSKSLHKKVYDAAHSKTIPVRDPKCGENRWALICEVKNLCTHSEFPLGSLQDPHTRISSAALQDVYKKIIKDHVRSCKISNQGLSGSVGDRNRAAVRNLSLSQDPSNISPQGSSHISAKSPQNFTRHVPTGVLWLSARAIPGYPKSLQDPSGVSATLFLHQISSGSVQHPSTSLRKMRIQDLCKATAKVSAQNLCVIFSRSPRQISFTRSA